MRSLKTNIESKHPVAGGESAGNEAISPNSKLEAVLGLAGYLKSAAKIFVIALFLGRLFRAPVIAPPLEEI